MSIRIKHNSCIIDDIFGKLMRDIVIAFAEGLAEDAALLALIVHADFCNVHIGSSNILTP